MYFNMKKTKKKNKNEEMKNATVTLPYEDFQRMYNKHKASKRKPYKTGCMRHTHGRIDSWSSGVSTITIPTTHEQLMHTSPEVFADKCKLLLMDYREAHRPLSCQLSLFDDFFTDPAA